MRRKKSGDLKYLGVKVKSHTLSETNDLRGDVSLSRWVDHALQLYNDKMKRTYGKKIVALQGAISSVDSQEERPAMSETEDDYSSVFFDVSSSATSSSVFSFDKIPDLEAFDNKDPVRISGKTKEVRG